MIKGLAPSPPEVSELQTQGRGISTISAVGEIGKCGEWNSEHVGSPTSALLPHLERETSSARFRDVNLDAELDLSWVNHIATANDVTGRPAPLKDRYRIVRVPLPRPSRSSGLGGERSAGDRVR